MPVSYDGQKVTKRPSCDGRRMQKNVLRISTKAMVDKLLRPLPETCFGSSCIGRWQTKHYEDSYEHWYCC